MNESPQAISGAPLDSVTVRTRTPGSPAANSMMSSMVTSEDDATHRAAAVSTALVDFPTGGMSLGRPSRRIGSDLPHPARTDRKEPTMRPLIVSTFLTLDGVLQAPGGPGEDEAGGFALGGWSVNYWDETMNQVMAESMSGPFDLLLGRKTYDIFAAYWPQVPDDEGGKALNAATKYVASRSRPTFEWSQSVLLAGDAADAVAALKREEGPELQVHGSGNLIQTLIRHNLVDEYRLWVFPLLVGS